jgi:TonB family protein
MNYRCRAKSAGCLGLSIALAWLGSATVAGSSIGERVAGTQQVPQLARMHEIPIRRLAINKVTPQYPAGPLSRRSQGVAVAAIRISPEGKVLSCRVLESPHDEIGNVVCAAATLWTFQPVTYNVKGTEYPIAVDTKLTFYFGIGPDGQGVVTEPAVPPKSTGAKEEARFTELTEDTFARELAGKRGVILLDVRDRPDFQQGHRAAL